MMSFRRMMKAPRPNHPAQRTKLHPNHPAGLQIFSTISKSYERSTLLVVEKCENFTKRQASTLEQLYFLHECLRQHVLPTSVRYRPPIKHPLVRRIAVLKSSTFYNLYNSLLNNPDLLMVS
ncbi:hypothetical protein MS3_00000236 [Schistosoma haematobium]|uniref:Uncharacterized protein n=1 Tax=Schistosoma haematobium TaxID=6185 RepID=A0A922LH85_SCHHA|nr:hypothetical protein MS3_00000236 [Schistosoma haematobium]KAH9584644.1 hypothetical protein MS3_00000236 [Schistosoma haematobium]